MSELVSPHTPKEGEWADRYRDMLKEALESADYNPEISSVGRQLS